MSGRVDEWMNRLLLYCNHSRFLQVTFFRPFGALRVIVATLPGAYAPGYALFRPIGPNKEKESVNGLKKSTKLDETI